MKVVATQRGTKGAADQHAERMGWEVMRVFKDEGRSAYSGEFRPGFEDMLKSLARAASRC